jgi:uncharacterized protein (TIGR02145 family)
MTITLGLSVFGDPRGAWQEFEILKIFVAMKKNPILVALFTIASLGLLAQRSALELTFTADNYGTHVQLDSIKVMNLTRSGDTVMYWPDTVLSIYFTGLSEPSKQTSDFRVFQNYPNPVVDRTTISIFVPEKDNVSLLVTDMAGRIILSSAQELDRGTHSLSFVPGDGNLYIFTAQWRDKSSSIKIPHVLKSPYQEASLKYLGHGNFFHPLKISEDIRSFIYNPGDTLLCIGYKDTLESGILDNPEESRTYAFQFASNIPCNGTPTVDYEGQLYNTVQIFSQCWIKENLNVGLRITGGMTDNGIIEKYCYDNDPDNCAEFGGLYQWDEMMQYSFQEGGQGICPPGWHIPTDPEWKVLEGSVDSQYGIGDQEWDMSGESRGNDAGYVLKSSVGWYLYGGGSDSFGFGGRPGGNRVFWFGQFAGLRACGYWWTSTKASDYSAFRHSLNYDKTGPGRDELGIGYSGCNSVRCIRND